ncbi:hypothetical protein [Komagataeibacter nataicola]|uniref:hypothetical protein n=1 Tax=Komagataeibacter nataicola TaxID=265960 RepID=UPI001F29DB0D|nr:hypothetical protein [Komagataeibacter nataicola]
MASISDGWLATTTVLRIWASAFRSRGLHRIPPSPRSTLSESRDMTQTHRRPTMPRHLRGTTGASSSATVLNTAKAQTA